MNSNRRSHAVTAALVLGGAIVASAVIVFWHSDRVVSTLAIAGVAAAIVATYHERRDLLGLALGATAGNAIELVCDLTGVWRHADRFILGLAPPYILICYPILGVAMPRLIDIFTPPGKGEHRGAAGLLLVLLVGLSMRFGTDFAAQSIVCAILLAATFWKFHTRRDWITAGVGSAVALIWEIPATLAGAWSFPRTPIIGLIPLWLPAAYAVFFVTMDRLSTDSSVPR